MRETSLFNHSIRATGVFAAGFIVVFLIAGSTLEYFPKILAAVLVFFGSAILVLAVLPGLFKEDEIEADDSASKSVDEELEEELTTLEEAAVFFSASMEPAEMLRLVAARLEGVIDGVSIDFYLRDEEIELKRVGGSASSNLTKSEAERVFDLSQSALQSATIEKFESTPGSGHEIHASAVPLLRGEDVVSICTFSADESGSIPADATLQTIATRVEPLIAGSLSFSTSVSNALTDSLTNLPNERAMYLILENQVAEAQRYGPTRPLTILAIDIRSFDEINRRFGHAIGDKLLAFTGGLIREQLRKMDFLARTSDDEFFLILPTVEGASSKNVQTRITNAFQAEPFTFAEDIVEGVDLCFGTATFGDDGDTSAALIRTAVERKLVDKSSARGSVLQFPKPE